MYWSAFSNNWIWAGTEHERRVDPKTGKGAMKRPRKMTGKTTKKPESGNYWIITSVKDGAPYYLTEIDSPAGCNVTYTWNSGKEGLRKAVIFLNENEAWDVAYRCRGFAVTKTVMKRKAEDQHDTDED